MSQEPATVYGDLDQVRQRLNLDPDEVEWNDRINRALAMAFNRINTKLKPYETVPLMEGYDPSIDDIANDYAAAITVEETGGNPTDDTEGIAKVRTLRARADRAINDYIRTTFGVDPEAIIEKGTVLGAVHQSASSYVTDEMSAEWSE